MSYTPRPGGYSTADRYSVRLADGRGVFVKSAEDENSPPGFGASTWCAIQREQLAIALDWLDRELF